MMVLDRFSRLIGAVLICQVLNAAALNVTVKQATIATHSASRKQSLYIAIFKGLFYSHRGNRTGEQRRFRHHSSRPNNIPSFLKESHPQTLFEAVIEWHKKLTAASRRLPGVKLLSNRVSLAKRWASMDEVLSDEPASLQQQFMHDDPEKNKSEKILMICGIAVVVSIFLGGMFAYFARRFSTSSYQTEGTEPAVRVSKTPWKRECSSSESAGTTPRRNVAQQPQQSSVRQPAPPERKKTEVRFDIEVQQPASQDPKAEIPSEPQKTEEKPVAKRSWGLKRIYSATKKLVSAAKFARAVQCPPPFTISSPKYGIQNYKWMTLNEAKAAALPLAEFQPEQASQSKALIPITPPWSSETVQRVLKEKAGHDGVDTNLLERLAKELLGGSCSLVVTEHHGTNELWRVVDLVSVAVWHPTKREIMVQDNERTHYEGATDFRKDMKEQELLPLPGTLVKANESVLQAAERALRAKIKSAKASYAFDGVVVKTWEEEEDFGPYRGVVKTRIRRHLLQSVLVCEAGSEDVVPDQVVAEGALHSGQVYYWHWRELAAMPILAKHRHWIEECCPPVHQTGTKGSKKSVRSSGRRISSATLLDNPGECRTVLPWSEAEVQALLQKHSIDAAFFGMSAEELSKDASAGEFFFAQEDAGGPLLCVSNTIHLRIVSVNGNAVLAKMESGTPKWPQHKWPLHESAWECARRLLRNQMMMTDGTIQVGTDDALQLVPGLGEGIAGIKSCKVQNWVLTGCIPPGLEHLSVSIHGDALDVEEEDDEE